MLCKWCGVGGWHDNVSCTCTHVGCCASGVGLGGDDNDPCTCTHVGCYASGLGWGGKITFFALAHMLDATQVVWGWMLRKWCGVGGDDNVPQFLDELSRIW